MEITEMTSTNIREFMIWLNGFEHSFKEDSIGIFPNSTQYRMIKSKLDLVTKCFDITEEINCIVSGKIDNI
jgi:hypothetical protein